MYSKEGLPPSLLQKMGIMKARNSPHIESRVERSDTCTAFGDASFCAVYAAICVAQQRRQG